MSHGYYPSRSSEAIHRTTRGAERAEAVGRCPTTRVVMSADGEASMLCPPSASEEALLRPPPLWQALLLAAGHELCCRKCSLLLQCLFCIFLGRCICVAVGCLICCLGRNLFYPSYVKFVVTEVHEEEGHFFYKVLDVATIVLDYFHSKKTSDDQDKRLMLASRSYVRTTGCSGKNWPLVDAWRLRNIWRLT